MKQLKSDMEFSRGPRLCAILIVLACLGVSLGITLMGVFRVLPNVTVPIFGIMSGALLIGLIIGTVVLALISSESKKPVEGVIDPPCTNTPHCPRPEFALKFLKCMAKFEFEAKNTRVESVTLKKNSTADDLQEFILESQYFVRIPAQHAFPDAVLETLQPLIWKAVSDKRIIDQETGKTVGQQVRDDYFHGYPIISQDRILSAIEFACSVNGVIAVARKKGVSAQVIESFADREKSQVGGRVTTCMNVTLQYSCTSRRNEESSRSGNTNN